MPLPSLVVTRNLNTALGPQAFVPARLLRGLLPDALLEQYAFWQDYGDEQGRGDALTGYATHDAARGTQPVEKRSRRTLSREH